MNKNGFLCTMIYLTRREMFNAAHRLYREDWDDEQNFRVFGACSNPNWHGHNYTLFVTVKGDINPDLGLTANLKSLSMIIREQVILKIDHRNVNIEVDFMKGRMASVENIAVAIWEQLDAPIREMGIELHCIRLEETENNYVEYYG